MDWVCSSDQRHVNFCLRHKLGQSASDNTHSAQGDPSITNSFDTWLQGWNAYEKLYMAFHPHQYPELASYREPTQLANRRWPPVYLFDIQARMAYAIKILHALPWVPETFLARFPVFGMAPAYGRKFVSVRSTPKIPTTREKNLWYTGYARQDDLETT